jgi:hypothetical protein
MDGPLVLLSERRPSRWCIPVGVTLAVVAGVLSIPQLAQAAPSSSASGPVGAAVPTGTVTGRAPTISPTGGNWTRPPVVRPTGGLGGGPAAAGTCRTTGGAGVDALPVAGDALAGAEPAVHPPCG